jgi:hypothetical protein
VKQLEIIKADDMKELSEFGKEEFEKSVLEGPLLKSVIRNIEDSALGGYTGWTTKFDSSVDVREFKVIQKYLTDAGFNCEIKSELKKGLVYQYTQNSFHVNWR